MHRTDSVKALINSYRSASFTKVKTGVIDKVLESGASVLGEVINSVNTIASSSAYKSATEGRVWVTRKPDFFVPQVQNNKLQPVKHQHQHTMSSLLKTASQNSVVKPLLNSMYMPSVIRKVDVLNPYVKRLRLEVMTTGSTGLTSVKDIRFDPGQWCDFRLKGQEYPIGGYSFASAARDMPYFELAVQREKNHDKHEAKRNGAMNGATETMTSWIHSDACAEGAEVEIQMGTGTFLLKPDDLL